MTILLSLTVFLNTVSDTIPVSSDSPIIGNRYQAEIDVYVTLSYFLTYLEVAITTIWMKFEFGTTVKYAGYKRYLWSNELIPAQFC